MPKVIVIYHSQQFGDTKTLAEELAEGVREAGAEVEIISTNERRINDIYLWDKSGESVKGKPAVLFFSHGGGGRGREPFEYLAGKFFEQVGDTVESRRPTGDEAKEQCRTLGKELVKRLK